MAQQSVVLQAVMNKLTEAGDIANAIQYEETMESLTACLNASSGPNITDLTNLTRVRARQPLETITPREMAAAGPAWVQGNNLAFRFCVNDARTFDVTGANIARQEANNILIRAVGFRYNASIAAADFELLKAARVTITIPGNTNFTPLQTMLNDLLIPSSVQLGMEFDPANATGRLIPGPVKTSTYGPLWTPPEALFVQRDSFALVQIDQLPGAPSAAAAGTVQLQPVFTYDNYLQG